MTLPTWNPSYDLLAQISHFLAGALIILLCLWFWPLKIWRGWKALLVWVISKEFLFDILIEKATFANGYLDATAYILGAVVASAVVIYEFMLNFSGAEKDPTKTPDSDSETD